MTLFAAKILLAPLCVILVSLAVYGRAALESGPLASVLRGWAAFLLSVAAR